MPSPWSCKDDHMVRTFPTKLLSKAKYVHYVQYVLREKIHLGRCPTPMDRHSSYCHLQWWTWGIRAHYSVQQLRSYSLQDQLQSGTGPTKLEYSFGILVNCRQVRVVWSHFWFKLVFDGSVDTFICIYIYIYIYIYTAALSGTVLCLACVGTSWALSAGSRWYLLVTGLNIPLSHQSKCSV
jgi:hypothetical protein